MSSKRRVGQLISSHIRLIAQEKNEDGINNAELLARQLWQMALGKFKTVNSKTGEIKTLPPDRDAMHTILDRMEGTAGTLDDTKKRHESLPDKMSRQNKERINKLAAEDN